MLILKAIILGFVQGVSEFFPVSGSGHVAIIGSAIGVNVDLYFMIMLHIGALASVILYLRRDIFRCLQETAGLFKDLCFNFKLMFVHTGGMTDETQYRNVLAGGYRKIALMLIITSAATAVVGSLIISVAELLSGSVLCSGMGFFITALILLVASYTHGNKKGPKEARVSDALMIGAFQCVAALPGVSRFAMTYSSGLFRGFSKKFSRLYALLLFIPASAGALLLEGARCSWSSSFIGVLPAVCGLLSAMAGGYLAVRFAFKIIEKVPVRFFSIYCFCIGAVSVLF